VVQVADQEQVTAAADRLHAGRQAGPQRDACPLAVGAIGALRAAGRRVPEDVAVVGFDDSAAATMVEPALTTMRNPIEQNALEALRILDDQIAGRVQQPVHVVLSSELVERSSA
jgi:DNA-binding LacI/PurR family transcriptional regulator